MAIRLTSGSNQWLSVTSSTGVSPQGPYTVCLWAYFETFPDQSALISISQDVGSYTDLRLTSSTLELVVGDGSGSDTAFGSTSLSTGVWYFISLVRSGGNSASCYVNNVLEATNTYDLGSAAFGDFQFRKIGADYAERFPLDGRVWSIKIWDSALSIAELKREQYSNRPVKKALYWYPTLSTNSLKDYGFGSDLSATAGYTIEESPPVAFRPATPGHVFPAVIYPADFSTSVRNAWLDSVESSIGSSPVLEIRTGTQPADCAASDTGTLLVSVTLPSDWMSNASAGSKSKSGTWSASASATGTAGHFRIKKSGTCHIQGSISTAGGGGDMILDNLSIFSGQAFAVSTATISSY